MAAFSKRAAELDEEGNAGAARALHLLVRVCHPILRPEDDDGPFRPVMTTEDGRRTVLPEDLSDDELDALAALLPGITDSILAARVADILWIRRRDYKAARRAVDLYHQAARQLESAGELGSVVPNLARSAALAAEVGGGPQRALFKSILDTAADILRGRIQNGERRFVLPLFSFLLERRHGDMSELAGLASRAAGELVSSDDLHQGIDYLGRAARAYQLAGDEVGQADTHRKIADLYVALAERDPSKMNASVFTKKAIEHLRHVPGSEARRESLHAQLRKYQKESVNEYGRFSFNLDLGDQPIRAAETVGGRHFMEALFLLALGHTPVNPDKLRSITEESTQENILQFLMPATMTDETGRTLGTKPGGFEDHEGALAGMMLDHLKIVRARVVGEHIEPMRIQIQQEHASHAREELKQLVGCTWFIPPGREHTFHRGLLAGLEGDFITTAYFLIPQVEHAMRHILQEKDIITSSLRTDGRQNEFALTVTLYPPYVEHLEAVLGKSAVYELRTLLVEPLGPALRNNAMHGLMADGAFFSRPVAYFWWLVLWLCCQGYTGPLPDGFERVSESSFEEGDV